MLRYFVGEVMKRNHVDTCGKGEELRQQASTTMTFFIASYQDLNEKDINNNFRTIKVCQPLSSFMKRSRS